MTTTTNNASSTSAAASIAPVEHPTRDVLKIFSIVLALIGFAISAYITYAHLTNTETVCPANAIFNCDLVQNSVYSKVGPIPVQFLGLGGYLAIFLALILETRIGFLQARGKLLIFGFTLFGFMFSLYLTAIEAFVLHSWCLWCLGSAFVMTTLMIVSFVRQWQAMSTIPADVVIEGEDEE